MKKRVAIVIPCRSGSKRIPNKNMQKVNGTSLIRRAANAAVSIAPTVGRFDIEKKVIVATDSGNHEEVVSELASLSKLLTVRERTCGPDGPSADVVADALEGEEFDVCCLVQCTSPFIRPYDIEECVLPIMLYGAVSAAQVYKHKRVELKEDSYRRGRTYVFETGAVYAATEPSLLQQEGRIGCEISDPMRSMEIDEPHELELANIIAEAKGW